MRYREGTVPGEADSFGGGEMYVFAAIIGLVIGIVLSFVGVRGRQFWLMFWGGFLVLKSVVYIAAMTLGYA